MKRKEDSKTSPAKSKRKSAVGSATPAPEPDITAEEDLQMGHDDMEGHSPEDDEEGGLRIGDIYIPPPPQGIGTYGSDGSRLIITHIDNENFKSYAGKTTLGPFHKCFTSIVGPNGSGKSNVIDSMLFVFGYRASKIRSKKISVLIHNSDQHRHCQSCTVAVHFKLIIDKPGDDYEVVQNSGFVIARTAFRDNSSYYTIDGRRVQFKEVAALLRSHKVDLDHNRFLILQGEVEQIAMMKPKGQTEHETGMLEFLEDIIGTNRYKEPIEKLNALIDNLNEERIEKLNRAKMVEKEKDALEGPKNEAVKALRIENQFNIIMHKHLQKYLLGARREVQRNEEKKKEVEDGMGEMKVKLKEVEDKVKEKEGAVAEITKEMEKMQAQKEKLSDEFKKISNKDNTIQADIEQNNKKRKRLQEQVKEEEKKLAELQLIPGKNEKQIEELKVLEPKVQADCEQEQKALEIVMKSMGEETKDLTDKKDKLQNKLVGLREVLGAHRAKYDVAQKELEIYLQNEKDEQKKFDELTTKYTSNGEKIESNKTGLQELKKKVPAAQRALETAQKEITGVNEEEAAVSAQLRAQRGVVEEARSSQAASRSQNVVLDTLMQRKRDGTLPGVVGRLGDLGGINQKYDVAVSTACPQLDFIVVDTVVTGQACVDYLKKYNVGRANFIALDKQQHLWQKCQQKMDTPENVPRLYDLIDVPDEKVRPAFYYVMRDTLVANDLDQASRIGYGRVRHRVVTLGGELIEPAGTMSGGGRTQIRGKMGRQSKKDGASAQEINALVKKLENLEQRWRELTARQTELNDEIRTLTQRLQADSATLKHSEMELEALTKQQPDLEQQLKRQKQRVKEACTDPKHVKALETKLSKIEEDVSEAAEAESKVSKDVQKLTQEIEKLTSGKMKAQQKKLDDVTNRLDKIRAEITKLNVAIKTSTRNANKTKDKIANMKQEVEDIKASLLKMVKERDNCEDEGKKVLDMLETVSNGILEKEADVKVVRDELGVFLAEEKEIKSSKMDVDQKISALKSHIQEKKKSIQLNTDKIKKLKLHHIPGDETQDVFVELSEEELDKLNSDKMQYEISSLEGLVQKFKPDFAVIEEYNKKDAQFLKRAKELDEVTERRNTMKNHYEMACKRRLDEFTVGFRTITDKLKEMYQMITLGGDAELELVDSFNPFVEGIVFSVRPPKKSWKNISNLSGGEKTLSSLALVFALHYYKPTPLYVMDEIDAALDFKNVSIVGNYIKERTKNAQFIIISLRSNMFELADTLVGIYKTNNCTKTATINPSCFPSKSAISHPQSQSQSVPPALCSDQMRKSQENETRVQSPGPMEVSVNADAS